jgi:hypothetical protein
MSEGWEGKAKKYLTEGKSLSGMAALLKPGMALTAVESGERVSNFRNFGEGNVVVGGRYFILTSHGVYGHDTSFEGYHLQQGRYRGKSPVCARPVRPIRPPYQ